MPVPGINLPALVSWRQRRQVASRALPARVGWTGVHLALTLALTSILPSRKGALLGASCYRERHLPPVLPDSERSA